MLMFIVLLIAATIAHSAPDQEYIKTALSSYKHGFHIYSPAAITSLGDVNGDGVDDILIAASSTNVGSGSSNIVASIIFGLNQTRKHTAWDYYLRDLNGIQGVNIRGKLGANAAIAGLGDVNGDGINDFSVASAYNGNGGIVYVLYGQLNMIEDINLDTLSPSRGYSITSNDVRALFGYRVSRAGDVNGDSLADFVVTSPGFNSNQGRTYLVYGAKTNPDISSTSLLPKQGITITGEARPDFSGNSVSAIGDFNQDGFDDIIIGAYGWKRNTGKAYIIFGGKNLTNIELKGLTVQQGISIVGSASDDGTGYAVSSAGDVNQDDLLDVMISSPFHNHNQGKVTILYGKSQWTKNVLQLSKLTSADGFVINGDSTHLQLGYSLTLTHDFNGDGLADLLISAFDDELVSSGCIYVLLGKREFAWSTIDLSQPPQGLGFMIVDSSSKSSSISIGKWISDVGDINSDGISDIGFGSPFFVMYGEQKDYPIWETIDVASFQTVANLEMLSDPLIAFHNGSSITALHMFNGDTYDDLAITSSFASPLDRLNAGIVFVVFGKWEVYDFNLQAIASSNTGLQIYGSHAGDTIGVSSAIATAGDFNGDGLEDLLIGCPFCSGPGRGVVYIIFGQTTFPKFIDLLHLNNTIGIILKGSPEELNCGKALGRCGDLNADGFDEIWFSCSSTSGGSIHVIYGMNTTESLLQTAHSFRITNSHTDGDAISLEKVVGSYIGDIDGDLLPDVIFGFPITNKSKGVVVVLQGNHSMSDIDINDFNRKDGIVLEGEKFDDHFGAAISGGYDFNGDGLPDLVISAPGSKNHTGLIYVLYGRNDFFVDPPCIGNLTSRQGFAISGSSAGDYFGSSLSMEGDINHDDYADIVIGAERYSNSTGAVYIIYGGSQSTLAKVVPNKGQVRSVDSLNTSQCVQFIGEFPGEKFGKQVIAGFDIDGNRVDDIAVILGQPPEDAAVYLLPSQYHPTSSPSFVPTLFPSPGPSFMPSLAPYEHHRTKGSKVHLNAEQKQGLAIAIPSLGIAPFVYLFSKKGCYYVLQHWTGVEERNNGHLVFHHRNILQVFAYTICDYTYGRGFEQWMDQRDILLQNRRSSSEYSAEGTEVQLSNLNLKSQESDDSEVLLIKKKSSLQETKMKSFYNQHRPFTSPQQRSRYQALQQEAEAHSHNPLFSIAIQDGSTNGEVVFKEYLMQSNSYFIEGQHRSDSGSSGSEIDLEVRSLLHIEYDDPMINQIMNGYPISKPEMFSIDKNCHHQEVAAVELTLECNKMQVSETSFLIEVLLEAIVISFVISLDPFMMILAGIIAATIFAFIPMKLRPRNSSWLITIFLKMLVWKCNMCIYENIAWLCVQLFYAMLRLLMLPIDVNDIIVSLCVQIAMKNFFAPIVGRGLFALVNCFLYDHILTIPLVQSISSLETSSLCFILSMELLITKLRKNVREE